MFYTGIAALVGWLINIIDAISLVVIGISKKNSISGFKLQICWWIVAANIASTFLNFYIWKISRHFLLTDALPPFLVFGLMSFEGAWLRTSSDSCYQLGYLLERISMALTFAPVFMGLFFAIQTCNIYKLVSQSAADLKPVAKRIVIVAVFAFITQFLGFIGVLIGSVYTFQASGVDAEGVHAKIMQGIFNGGGQVLLVASIILFAIALVLIKRLHSQNKDQSIHSDILAVFTINIANVAYLVLAQGVLPVSSLVFFIITGGTVQALSSALILVYPFVPFIHAMACVAMTIVFLRGSKQQESYQASA